MLFEIKKVLSVVNFFLLDKTNRFHVAVRLFCNRSQKTSNVVRTSVAHSAVDSCVTVLFLPHFDVIYDLLLNRRKATWNLFFNRIMAVRSYLQCN